MACTAGTYWVDGACELCDFNTYQPDEAQTSCLNCADFDADKPITYYQGSAAATDCAGE